MKKVVFLLVFLALFLFLVTPVKAESLMVIDNNGNVIWRVLSAQDSIALKAPERDIDVTRVASSEIGDDSLILLEKKDEKFYLNDLDVTDFGDDLVEIEERGEVNRLVIGIDGSSFTIEQNGVVAATEFPITIDPKRNELALKTESGSVFLSVLPIEAAESALRSRFISRLADNKVTLTERTFGILSYTIGGEKVLNVFNLFDYKIPVTAHVSASTGEILSIDGPEWFKIFSFLFS